MGQVSNVAYTQSREANNIDLNEREQWRELEIFPHLIHTTRVPLLALFGKGTILGIAWELTGIFNIIELVGCENFCNCSGLQRTCSG